MMVGDKVKSAGWWFATRQGWEIVYLHGLVRYTIDKGFTMHIAQTTKKRKETKYRN